MTNVKLPQMCSSVVAFAFYPITRIGIIGF